MATPDAFVAGPRSRATRYRLAAGTLFVSVLFRAGQLRRLFNAPMQLLTDTHWPLEELAGNTAARVLVSRLREQPSPRMWVDVLSGWIRERTAMGRSGAGTRQALSVTNLFSAPAALARQNGIGLRQFERRFLATYGQPLRGMRRTVRFVNALAGVISGSYASGGLAQLSLSCGYFDQAHMTRDFCVELAGVPPSRIASHAQVDPALKLMRYDRQELDLVVASPGQEPLLSPPAVAHPAMSSRYKL